MKKQIDDLKLTKHILIPFPNFQENTIISPTQINDNFEEIEYGYNQLIDNHNKAIETIKELTNKIKLLETLINNNNNNNNNDNNNNDNNNNDNNDSDEDNDEDNDQDSDQDNNDDNVEEEVKVALVGSAIVGISRI